MGAIPGERTRPAIPLPAAYEWAEKMAIGKSQGMSRAAGMRAMPYRELLIAP